MSKNTDEKNGDAVLKRMLQTPHKPHVPKKAKVVAGKPKAKQSNKNR